MEDIVRKLVEEGILDADGAYAVRTAISTGSSADDALRSVKGLAEDKLLRFLSSYFDMPYLDLERDGAAYAPPKELLAKLPLRLLIDHHLMPLSENGDGEGGPARRHQPGFRQQRPGRTSAGNGAGGAPVPCPCGGHRSLRQEAPRRRGRHPAVDGHQRR